MKIEKFSRAVLSEAVAFRVNKKLLTGRKRTSGITIDPENSKDLDDAFLLKKSRNKFILQVSIADAASAVKPSSPIFKAALKRGSTLYFANKSIGMIPKILCEDKLSLLPGERKGALTITIKLSEDLDIEKVDIARTAFQSKRRLSYAEADKIIDTENKDPERNHLIECYSLAARLLQKRQMSGALAIYDILRGVFSNEEGQLIRLLPEQAHKSNIIVQEFMILANTAVSEFLLKKNRTFLFRNHTARAAVPDRNEIIQQYNLALLSENRMEALIKRIPLWFNPAKYETKLKGHFGLNLPAYSHFTSPLRRAADLVNQNILLAALEGKRSGFSKVKLESICRAINSRMDKIKEKRGKSFKAQTLKKMSKKIAEERFEQLLSMDRNAFGSLLKQACKQNIISYEFQRAAEARIDAGGIGVEHLYYLIFESPKDSGESSEIWHKLKMKTVESLSMRQGSAFQIIQMAVQRNILQKAEVEYAELDSGFAARVIISKDNQVLSSPAYDTAPTKKQAQHLAAVSLLKSWIENALVLPSETIVAGVEGKDRSSIIRGQGEFPLPAGPRGFPDADAALENFVGQLQELCVKSGKPAPEYTYSKFGSSHQPVFTAVCIVGSEKTEGKGPSKKRAKQLSAKSMLEILTPDKIPAIPNSIGTQDQQLPIEEISDEDIAKNYINLLDELYVKQKSLFAAAPQYRFETSGKSPNQFFTCTCFVTFDGNPNERSGISNTKRKSKHIAAKKMYECLSASLPETDLGSLPPEDSQIREEVRPSRQAPSIPSEAAAEKNFVGLLQELCSRNTQYEQPEFSFTLTGTPENIKFKCRLELRSSFAKFVTHAEASSKKTAKQLAARKLLEKINPQEQLDFH